MTAALGERGVRSMGLALLLLVLVSGCSGTGGVFSRAPWNRGPLVEADVLASLPTLDREFRAVWIATVANIDWPSQPGLPEYRQKDELIRLLDRAETLGMNAVIFQVRPTADAMYASELEPWSWYLAGDSTAALQWDPLAFIVEESHRRGMELHAWFNPFRAWHSSAPTPTDTLSVAHTLPGAVIQYGEQAWLDPGDSLATEHSRRVVLDVVRRYDVDGVHLDDYFYPYPIQDSTGQDIDFPDSLSWAASGVASDLSRSDWRRRNVDRFVEDLYDGIKAQKPWVLFGISPFGIWRPGFPEGIIGFDQYERLYADARRWLQEGWVDYFSPQLYWALESEGQPYDRLLDWWIDQNAHGRHIWPGLFTSRVILEEDAWWGPDEIVRQVRHTRSVAGSDGNIHFSMRALMPSAHGMGETVATELYGQDAVRPETTWLGGDTPSPPRLVVARLGDVASVSFRSTTDAEVRVWAVRILERGRWHAVTVPGWRRSILLDRYPGADAVVVQAVTRLGRTSEPAVALIDP